jgi:hypothetical protein
MRILHSISDALVVTWRENHVTHDTRVFLRLIGLGLFDATLCWGG